MDNPSYKPLFITYFSYLISKGNKKMEENFGNNIFNTKIGPSVKLFIFTPRQHNVSVIRPYVYNFDTSMVDAFINNKFHRSKDYR